jgi:hypothetical protein
MTYVANDNDVSLNRIEDQIDVGAGDDETDPWKIGLGTEAGERAEAGNSRFDRGGDIGGSDGAVGGNACEKLIGLIVGALGVADLHAPR